MAKVVEDIGTLKINLLSQAQYEAEVAGGTIEPNELYLTPSSGSGVADVEVNGESVVSGGVAEITINDIPSGGTMGQILTKGSGTDYDVSWEDPSGGTITDVTVDGTSIVDDGVAELETVTQLRDGLMTATDKQKLDGIASGAEVNVQSDWNQSTSTADDYIKNKPTIPTIADTYSGTSSNGMSGKAVKSAIDALDGTITGNAGAGKTLTAFSQTEGKVSATFSNISITKSQVSDFPTIPSKVSDLTNDAGYITGYTETDPTVPSWAKQSSKPTYTASEVGALPDTTSIPSKVSDLTNDAGYITDYTETDPTVPSWAKASSKPSYTFSEIGSKPSTLSGYGITDAKIASGTITLGSDTITPLTSFTETDPIFTASDAYGIYSTDITNWDNSYDGKVSLDTSATSGTTDGDLYSAIVALVWENDVIE